MGIADFAENNPALDKKLGELSEESAFYQKVLNGLDGLEFTFPKVIIEEDDGGFVAHISGTGIVVSAETREQVIEELMTSLRVKILDDLKIEK